MPTEMTFESRVLKPCTDFIRVSELKEGNVYFRLHFVGAGLLIPEMEPVVFIGRNLEDNEVDRAYFQDVDSYLEGTRYPIARSEKSEDAETEASLHVFPEKSGLVMAVYEFESALEELMRCSLRRREKEQA